MLSVVFPFLKEGETRATQRVFQQHTKFKARYNFSREDVARVMRPNINVAHQETFVIRFFDNDWVKLKCVQRRHLLVEKTKKSEERRKGLHAFISALERCLCHTHTHSLSVSLLFLCLSLVFECLCGDIQDVICREFQLVHTSATRFSLGQGVFVQPCHLLEMVHSQSMPPKLVRVQKLCLRTMKMQDTVLPRKLSRLEVLLGCDKHHLKRCFWREGEGDAS